MDCFQTLLERMHCCIQQTCNETNNSLVYSLQNLLQQTENMSNKCWRPSQKSILQTLIALQQSELDKHFEHPVQGQIVPSRAKWAKLGKKTLNTF